MNREISQQTREICERYQRAMERNTPAGVIVGELAAKFDVQRPAVWKALRSGGVLPPYLPVQRGGKGRPLGGGECGYSQRRRDKALEYSKARFQPDASQFVERDPCPRCGTRGDIGCSHSGARLGTSF